MGVIIFATIPVECSVPSIPYHVFGKTFILGHKLTALYICQCPGTAVFPDSSQFGEGSDPIFLEGLTCSSESSNLLQCANNPIGVHRCTHSQDTGVRCLGKS